MPSIKDVARAAGVSTATVSYALNGKGNLSPATRQRVLEVVAALGYTRSASARAIRSQRARVVGFAQQRTRADDNPVLDRFLYELVPLVEAQDRHVLVFNCEAHDSARVYRRLWDSRRVDAFVLSFTTRHDPRFALLHGAAMPFVAFGRSLSALDALAWWVDVDGRAGVRATTQHLLAQGHTRLALAAWPDGSACGDERAAGFYDALGMVGIAPVAVLHSANTLADATRLGATLAAMPQPPSAVVCVSDVLGAGVLHAFRAAGRMVAVTGFDDTPVAPMMHPPLTSVRQPIAEVARVVAAQLAARLDDTPMVGVPRTLLLPPEVVVRASSLGVPVSG